MISLWPVYIGLACFALGQIECVDPTRAIDLPLLRQKSIDSYLSGQNYEALYKEAVDPKNMTVLLVILVLGIGFMLALVRLTD